MCALLSPIIKSGYNLFVPGFGSGQKSKQQNLVFEPTSSSLSSGHRSPKNGHARLGQVQPSADEGVRFRTTSEQSTLVTSSSSSSPTVMHVGVRRRNTGPPPVDANRRRSALSTSQYYLQQRRELARQQQQKRIEMAQKQFLEQQKPEKSLKLKNDENRH